MTGVLVAMLRPFVLQGELKNWLGENGSALIGVSARRPRIELSNDFEDLAGRTGVVYWNWVDELGDSSVCKTNGHKTKKTGSELRTGRETSDRPGK